MWIPCKDQTFKSQAYLRKKNANSMLWQIFNKVTEENFLKVRKSMPIHIQEAHRKPNRPDQKENPHNTSQFKTLSIYNTKYNIYIKGHRHTHTQNPQVTL